jgi:hypothetical protein
MQRTRTSLLATAALALAAAPALADGGARYEIEITNITKGQTFTPILVTTHSRSVQLFELGDPASEALEILAEAGDTGPIGDYLNAQGRKVGEVATIPGLLGPGETARVEIRATGRARHLSAAAMLIPTNDTFFAVNGVRLPRWGDTFTALAYDAGTEENDQSCRNIPGPRCGGEGHSPEPGDGDEGHVHVGNGFHELGDVDSEGAEVLGPFTYDWRNPVALVTVRRVR